MALAICNFVISIENGAVSYKNEARVLRELCTKF